MITDSAVSQKGATTANAVELRSVSHRYGATPVIEDIDLSILKGEFFGILGPSGSGKTTILRIVAGFVAPTQGTVMMNGMPMAGIPPHRRSSVMVFQQLALFPHMTVFQNIAYGLRVRRLPKAAIRDRVGRAMEVVRLAGMGKRYPRQLSGGQQQRVALARAIVIEPSVVLFDEPLASLDKVLRVEMQEELKRIHADIGSTFVYVTHDQQEAMKMCDRMAIMETGRIQQIGTSQEVYERPVSRFVARFVGEINVFTGRIVAVEGERAHAECGGMRLQIPMGGLNLSSGDHVDVCVRPESLRMGVHADACEHRWQAEVVDATYLGGHRRYRLVAPNGARVLVEETRTAGSFAVGETVAIGWNAADALVFSERAPEEAGLDEGL
jgi:ABC-type Fe3+/spermidine/putrescine transport system ATPase subunit